MQRHVLRTARNTLFRRTLSSSSFLAQASRPTQSRHFLDAFYRGTKDPIWRLIVDLRYPQSRHHSDSGGGMDKVLSKHSFTDAVDCLDELGYQVISTEQPRQPVPQWILLHLIGDKVRTSAHAEGPMLDLVYSNLEGTSESTRAAVLVLSAYHLARFNLVIPLRQVLQTFLTSAFPHPELFFNLFLQALSNIPYRSVESANGVVAILKAMESRQLKLQSQTYDSLLKDRFVTLQLTKFLQDRMIREGFVPNQDQLEAYLRVFSKHGLIDDAQQYHEAIHSLRSTAAEESEENPEDNPSVRANTLLLNAFSDRGSAFSFLRKLAAHQNLPDPPSVAEPGPTLDLGHGGEEDASEEGKDGHNFERGVLPHLPRRPHRFVSRSTQDIYDQTAALHVLAKDLTTTARSLMTAFSRFPNPSPATYTVLIRGLLLRREWTKAEVFWNKFVKSDLHMDREILTTGVRLLTRLGRPNAAFHLLEKWAKIPEQTNSNASSAPPARTLSSIPLTAICINEYLVALNRIARPDAVFSFFTHMRTLYAVSPNAQTLSILLQSARLATRMDDSLSGAFAQLRLANPFRRRSVYPNSDSRIKALDEITTVLGQSKGNPTPYRGGVYQDQKPVDFARGVFLRALWGTQLPTEEDKLAGISPPARVTKKTYDSEPYLRPQQYTFEPPTGAGLLRPDGKTWYPTISITNANCLNYLTLLGASGMYAGEIPLVLAWMRCTGIQPSESTLAVALVLWSEVSLQAPLVEKLRGGEEANECLKLIQWITDWVGEDRIPDQTVLRKWMNIIHRMRGNSQPSPPDSWNGWV